MLIWCLISAVFGGIFYLVKTLFKSHPLWAWAFPYLYIGALILFAIHVLMPPKNTPPC
jgi:hypothetical protein